MPRQLLGELETLHSPGTAAGTPLCGSMETSLQHGAGTPDHWETFALAKWGLEHHYTKNRAPLWGQLDASAVPSL